MVFAKGKQAFPLEFISRWSVQSFVTNQKAIPHNEGVRNAFYSLSLSIFSKRRNFVNMDSWEKIIESQHGSKNAWPSNVPRTRDFFSAKYENGIPWTHWKDKLLKLGLPVRRCSTAATQHWSQASNNTYLGQLVDALCTAETLEQDGISWAQQVDKLMSLESTTPNHI